MNTDQQFITDLYQQNKRLMFFLAGKCTTDPAVMEELVQESLLKLIQKVDVLRKMEQKAIATYIAITIKNTSINHSTSSEAEYQHLLPDEEVPEYDSYVSSDRSVEETILMREEVKKILAKLSERDRSLLINKYQYQLSDSELAEIFDCNVNNIRMMTTRAKRRVIRIINKEGLTYGNIQEYQQRYQQRTLRNTDGEFG